MDLNRLRQKTNTILKQVVGSSPIGLGTGAPSIYETLVLSRVIIEYIRLHGPVVLVTLPSFGRLNLGGGAFDVSKSYEIDFADGQKYYFAQNIYVQGLPALMGPVATDYFEVDVLVLKGNPRPSVVSTPGYPTPDEIDSVYECKYGAYKKGHLRELIGTKRHLSFVTGGNPPNPGIYPFQVDGSNSNPDIPVILFRPPNGYPFFSSDYAEFYNVGVVDYI